MEQPGGLVTERNVALLLDDYELTMAEAYLEEGLLAPATFSLFCRRLPSRRNYLVACGLEQVVEILENLRFQDDAVAWLRAQGRYGPRLLDWLAGMRFDGEVRAVPEGTPIFANEPLLEVTASLPVAQLVETVVMNQIHVQTLAASKAARVVTAASGARVVDFGARRMHGADAALKMPRAFYVSGVAATSNVLAGRVYGIPVAGTMAHSYIQAHDDEAEAFAAFARIHPGTTILVDTYDTLEGIRRVVRLARERGDAFRPAAVRLDSGDLSTLAKASRRLLDEGGLDQVKIFASSGLDEDSVAELVASGAPIDGFGVGTAMGASADAAALDLAYKLTEYDGVGRIKRSAKKPILPGRKQVFRVEADGVLDHDVIGREGEALPGRPLLETVMAGGRPAGSRPSLEAIRDHARLEHRRLPEHVRALAPADPPYPVHVSDALRAAHADALRALGATP
jgi:nicotinate phosphoribosyltransferase